MIKRYLCYYTTSRNENRSNESGPVSIFWVKIVLSVMDFKEEFSLPLQFQRKGTEIRICSVRVKKR
jgi:hypothetical protein